jgi:hypothetical protein
MIEAHYHSNRQDIISEKLHGEKKMLIPSAGLLPPTRRARGPLSVPCRLGTPAYNLQVKTKSGACNHTSPHTPQHWNLPPDRRGLRGCHMSSGSGARLPVREGSSIAMCTMASDPQGGLWPIMYHMASDPASLWGGLRAAMRPTVPCGPWASSMKKSLADLPVR